MAGNDVTEWLTPDLLDEAVSWRRHLHQHPELAFNERQTAEFIATQLSRFGLTVHRGLGGTGVIGTLKRGAGSQRTIAIRADMDALLVQERSGAQHTSTIPGVMHACGHDGHVAMALVAAAACSKLPELDGTVHFIFQPAEEQEGGALRMIDEGLFRQFPCDFVYALHNWPALPLGTCVARDGPMMAAMATFEITIRGKGGHGAMPHLAADPVVAACELVSALQSIVSRNINPLDTAVVSVTRVIAGEAFNVIPDDCMVCGSTRWFNPDVGAAIEQRIGELAKSFAKGFGCEAELRYRRLYPATINDSYAASIVREAARQSQLSVIDAHPSMASEDFAAMLQAVPGCYFWLGSGQPDYGLHSPRYDFNDALLPLGAGMWVQLVRRSLAAAV